MRWIRSFLVAGVGWLRSSGPAVRDGLLSAVFLASWWHQVTALLGESLLADVAVLWALASGSLLGRSTAKHVGWLHLGLAGWSGLMGVLLPGVVWGIGWMGLERLEIADGFPALLLAMTVLLAIPAGWVVSLALGNGAANEAPRIRLGGFLLGAGAGFLLAAHGLFGWLGVAGTMFSASLCSCAVFLWMLVSTARVAEPKAPDTVPTPAVSVAVAITVLLTGLVLSAEVRLLQQLMPRTEWFSLTVVAALCWGAAVGCRVLRRGTPLSWIPVGVLLLPVLFPWLVDLSLYVKLHAESPGTLLALQAMFVFAAMFPLGLLLSWSSERSSRWWLCRRVSMLWLPSLLAAGVVVGRWPLLVLVGVSLSLLIGSWSLVGVLLLGRMPSASRIRARVSLGGLLLVLVAVSMSVSAYQPATSARLLFSSQVVAAAEAGWPRHLLGTLDEARLVRTVETSQVTLTGWSYRGAQYHVRCSGVPAAVIGTDPGVCPRSAPTVLEAVVPLVLHQRPARILLLGAGGGVSLQTSLRFPVESIDCVEADRQLLRVLKDIHSDGTSQHTWTDPRLAWHHLPVPLSVMSRSGEYDVIIANSVPAVLWLAESTRTVEFYGQVSKQLAIDGIFCQALVVDDLGLEPVAILVRSLGRAFSSTALLSVGSGRFLLLATNSPRTLKRDGLLQRLQAPHVRSILAESGLDWVSPLQLGVMMSGEWAETGTGVASIRNGRLASQLPTHVLSRSRRSPAFQSVLGPKLEALLSWVPQDDEQLGEVHDRLEDLRTRQGLLDRSAESYRRYRLMVRKRISERPRQLLESIPGKGLKRTLHPDDRRRRRYFSVLENVLGEVTPEAASINRLTSFLVPYDPLLCNFIHRELAELWARSGQDDRRRELRHRLRAIYYGSSVDAGLQDVHAAAEILLEGSTRDEHRLVEWDQLNGLLEVLRRRWSHRLRRGADVSEMTEGLQLIERITDRLDQLAVGSSVRQSQWALRREVLERSLVIPLRDRRSLVLARRSSRAVLGN